MSATFNVRQGSRTRRGERKQRRFTSTRLSASAKARRKPFDKTRDKQQAA